MYFPFLFQNILLCVTYTKIKKLQRNHDKSMEKGVVTTILVLCDEISTLLKWRFNTVEERLQFRKIEQFLE